MNTLGIATALAGAVLFLVALRVTIHANQDTPIPYWRRPASEPRGAVPMRALGAGLTVFGAALIAQGSGWWALVIVLLGPGVAVIAVVIHNARVRRLPR